MHDMSNSNYSAIATWPMLAIKLFFGFPTLIDLESCSRLQIGLVRTTIQTTAQLFRTLFRHGFDIAPYFRILSGMHVDKQLLFMRHAQPHILQSNLLYINLCRLPIRSKAGYLPQFVCRLVRLAWSTCSALSISTIILFRLFGSVGQHRRLDQLWSCRFRTLAITNDTVCTGFEVFDQYPWQCMYVTIILILFGKYFKFYYISNSTISLTVTLLKSTPRLSV